MLEMMNQIRLRYGYLITDLKVFYLNRILFDLSVPEDQSISRI